MYVLENNLARHTIGIEVYHGMATTDRLGGTAVRNSDIQIARMLIENVGVTPQIWCLAAECKSHSISVWLLVLTAQHAAYLISSPSRYRVV